MPFHPRWIQRTAARLGGVAFAREAESVLAWDRGQRLYLWDADGKLMAQSATVVPIRMATISDDGRYVAVLGQDRSLWWFTHQLELHLRQELSTEPVAVAVETSGGCVAISSRDRSVEVRTRLGETVLRALAPRPIHFLAFVPTTAAIAVAADYGFLGCLDQSCRWLWQEAVATHVGGICCDGSGECVLASCFSQGIRWCSASHGGGRFLPTPAPCRLVDIDLAGARILIATESANLSLLDREGSLLGTVRLPCPARSVALGGLGEAAVYGLPDGQVVWVEISTG